MALIPLLRSYTAIGYEGVDYKYSCQERYFDTDTKLTGDQTYEVIGDETAPPSSYSYPTNQEVYGECLPQTTQRRSWWHVGAGSVTFQDADSELCGYVAPEPEPEPEPEVVLGCTDPTADNYNPQATEGNADENVCTYTPGILSEIKTIEVRSCPSEGVHVSWYNSLGGIDSWMFQGKVDTLFASEPTSEYTYRDGLKSAAGKVLTPSIVVNTSELNRNRFDTICGMFSSPLVWVNVFDSKKRVYVEPASDLGQRNIGQKLYSLQVRVSLQPLNALKN